MMHSAIERSRKVFQFNIRLMKSPKMCHVLFKTNPGFLEPTAGNAMVGGYDIRRNLTKVRESLGLCPQHDILFDSLTVEEHLKFFGRVSLPCTFALKSESFYTYHKIPQSRTV